MANHDTYHDELVHALYAAGEPQGGPLGRTMVDPKLGAQAVQAVRDAELEQLRAEVAAQRNRTRESERQPVVEID